MTGAVLPELAGLAEAVEAEFMYAYEFGAPAEVAAGLGIATARIGGGVVLAMRDDPVGYWNKALGFGVTEPVTLDVFAEVTEFYRAHGVSGAVLQIAPAFLPCDWDRICAKFGISAGSAWVKLGADIEAVHARADTELRVGALSAADAGPWAAAILQGYGMPDDRLALMVQAGATHPGFQPFAAWDGSEIVAGANLFVHERVGSLNTAATLPSHRGRGAQSALIAARVAAARSAGCRWVTAETGLPEPGVVNQSLANLERAGFRRLYIRRNWVWREADRQSDGGPNHARNDR